MSVDQKYSLFQDNENWYYINDGIYKINKNSGIKTLIHQVKSLQAYYLNNGWIYYADGNLNICRVKTNGQNYSVILNAKQFREYDEEPVNSLIIVDSKLFIQMNFGFYRYDMNTKVVTEIVSDARNIWVLGKNIYFWAVDRSIYKMNAYDEEPQALLKSYEKGSDQSQWKNIYKNFVFVDDVMYYYQRDPDGLYRYQNGESKLVDDDSDVNEFTLFENEHKLYYLSFRDEACKLKQYDPKKEKVTEVLTYSDFSTGPKIINGVFYYKDAADNVKQIKMP